MLNKNGDRFCDELGRRDYVSKLMRQHEHEGPFRLVLNKAGSTEIEWYRNDKIFYLNQLFIYIDLF